MKTFLTNDPLKLWFDCPGCGIPHGVLVSGPHAWEWNNDRERPTLAPSVLVTCLWGEERTPRRCHSFVRDGRIEFLPDCTHSLAGRTVDIPVWSRNWS